MNKELLRLKILEAYALDYISPRDDYDRKDSWGFYFESTFDDTKIKYHEFLGIEHDEFYTLPYCDESDEVHKQVSKEILNSPLMKALR